MSMDHYRFIFARHGQSEHNRKRLLQGQFNSGLTPTGVRQAEALAAYLHTEGATFDRIITSPLERARHTAQIIAEKLEAPLEIDENWKERHFGQGENQSYETIRSWFDQNGHPTPFEPAFENGETAWQIHQRAMQAVERLLSMPVGSYLVVAHGHVFSVVIGLILGILPSGGRRPPVHLTAFDNTSTAELEYHPNTGQWVLRRLNDTRHLVGVEMPESTENVL